MIKRSTLSRLRAAASLAAPAVFLLPSSLCLAVPPANDSFADAATLVTGTPQEGTNWEATMEPGEPVPEGYDETTYARTVWWSWTAPATGRFDFSTRDTSFRTVVAVWTGASADALTPVPEADGGTGGGAATTRARIMAVEGTVYHISVAGWGNDFHSQGPIVLRAAASPLPPNDHFADRLPLTTGTAWRGPIAGATREAWEPVLPSGEKENGSLWFSWTAPATGWFVLNFAGPYHGSRLAVWTGSDPAGLRLAHVGDRSFLLPATAGTGYQLALVMDTRPEPGEDYLLIEPCPEPQGPRVTSFTLTPDAVDVTAEDRMVSAVFSARDVPEPEKGVLRMRLEGRVVDIPFSSAHLTSGTPADGTWTVPLSIPRHFLPGTAWFAIGWDNWSWRGMLETFPFNTPAAPFLRIVNTGEVDRTEPVLASVEVSSGMVDITEADREITVTVRAVDPLSGVRRVSVFLKRGQTPHDVATVLLNAASRVSGTAHDGIYRGTMVIPGSTSPGVHPLEVEVEDLNDNRRRWAASQGNPPPGPSTGEVTVLRGPRIHIRSLTTDPAPVDITGGAVDFTVTFRLTADKGAVLENDSSTLRLDADGAPGGPALPPVRFGARERIQGTDADGVYQVRFNMPEGMPPGDYPVSLFTSWVIPGEAWERGQDFFGWTWPSETGQRFPWPEGVPPTVRVENNGIVDTEAPAVELTVPHPVMVRQRPQDGGDWRLDYQLAVTDNLDRSPEFYVYLTDAEGVPISGNFRTGPLLISSRTAPGSYFLAVMTRDRVGNSRVRNSGMPDFPGPFRGAVTVPVAINTAPVWNSWRAEVFDAAQAGDPAISGENADPDADGLTNLMEYALGLPPLLPDQAGAAMPELVRPEGWGSLMFRCTRAAGRRDLLWIVQAAPTPSGPWTPIQDSPQVPQETNTSRETVFWYISPSAAGTGFVRLMVMRH